jgi:flagellar basal body-associated protein FliL
MVTPNTKMVKTLRKVLLFIVVLLLISCHKDPLKSDKSLKANLKALDKTVSHLYGKDLPASDIFEDLEKASLLVNELQEGRDRMADEADRLTRESYEFNKRKIKLLQEGRLELYEGMDDFLVCSYHLSDVIKLSRYYHDRIELKNSLRALQREVIALVQRDAPHSAQSSFSYYKNLAKITSQAANEDGHWYYTVKVNFGYNYNEKETQTLLNSSKLAMGGIVRSYFSSLTKDDVLNTEEELLKAGLVMELNDYLIQFADFRKKKMEGVKIVTFDIIQYYEFM